VKPVNREAVAGPIGTAVMTVAMFLLKKIAMAPGELALKEITENLEKKMGVYERLPKAAFEASWTILQFGYGATSGAAFAFTEEKVLDLERPGLIGPLFGVLLWVVGYCGWLPIFGLYPPPTRLPKHKIGAELVATHLIYGTATAAAHQVLKSRSES
jgi:hypothetical protein